jgi:transposase-like protein
MKQGTFAVKAVKTQYSVSEAAQELGLSVEQLRALIRNHRIAETDEDLNNVAVTSFHPSDLLVLKLLSAQNGNPTPQG